MKTKKASPTFLGKFLVIVIFHTILCGVVYGQLDTDHFYSTRLNIYAQCERLCVASNECSDADYNYNTRTCYLYTPEMFNMATTSPQGPVVYSTSSKPSVCASVQCRSGEMCVMAGEGFLCLPATGAPEGTTAPAATGTTGGTTAPAATGTTGGTTAPAATGTTGGTTAPAATGTPEGTTVPAATGTTSGTTSPQDCSILSSEFSMTSGYYITQHNNEEVPYTSVDECKQRCLAATQYTCRSFDVRLTTEECLMSAESRATVPANEYRSSSNFEYYERLSICDV